MADPERVYCHECNRRWNRDQHPGLECPGCHSDFVEVIEKGQDPRDDMTEDDDSEENTDRGRGSRNQTRPNLWDDAPDPEEGDIPHPARPRIRVSSTIYRSSTPIGPEGQRVSDPFAPFFQSFSTIMDTGAGRQGSGRNRQNGGIPSPARSTDPGSMPPFTHTHDHNHRPWTPPGSGSVPGSPLREGMTGTGFGGGRAHFTTTTRVWPRDGINHAPQQVPTIDNLSGLLGTLLQSINGMNQLGQNGQGINGAIPPIHLFAHLLNPDNATHGDAVYTEEALDRVITQFMEQTHGTSAPGPASAEAISGLPKKEADKSMMGSDGKAECSVCMDNVDIGDEVTVLPCDHWFHGDCVGAWLKEHDTCPHCRQGIMPKDVDGSPSTSPRTPGQPPRNNSQSPQTPSAESGRGIYLTVQPPLLQPPLQQSEFRAPESQSRQHHHHHHRRRSSAREGRNGGEGSSGGGGRGGISAWMRDRWRGNSDRS